MLKFLVNRKVNLVSFMILVHLVFSYYYVPLFYSALIGTVLIIVLSAFAWPKNYKYWIGFQIGNKAKFITVVAFLVSLAGSFFIIKYVAKASNIRLIPGNYKDFIHTLFYTLNEEIILGALLLKGIQRRYKKFPQWLIAVGTAFIFAIVHFVFFRWIFLHTGNLTLLTLLSLFAVGIVRNNLILKTGHIGYSWALHFGWIYVMFGYSHLDQTRNVFLTDFERFGVYLGDLRILIVCLILVILSFMKWPRYS